MLAIMISVHATRAHFGATQATKPANVFSGASDAIKRVGRMLSIASGL